MIYVDSTGIVTKIFSSADKIISISLKDNQIMIRRYAFKKQFNLSFPISMLLLEKDSMVMSFKDWL